MTVNEIIELYKTATPVIFAPPKRFMSSTLNNWSKKYGFLLRPYTQEGLDSELKKLVKMSTVNASVLGTVS